MSADHCGKEGRVIEALRSGAWEPGLRDHVKDCPICADVLLVTEFLQVESKAAKAEAALPNAAFLWWKSQRLARQMALQQATGPIAFVRMLSFVACALAALWLLFVSAPARAPMFAALRDGILLQLVWSGDWGAVALLGLGGAVLGAILASFYMARA